MRITIYWQKQTTTAQIQRIRERFNIPQGITVNGETTCEIDPHDLDLLRQCEQLGYIQIRNKNEQR